MASYVNEQALFDWYDRVGSGRMSRENLLAAVLQQYSSTRREEFELAPSQTRTGRVERYPYRFENLGCCGASTLFFYF